MKKTTRILVLLVGLVIVGAVVFDCFYVVDETQYGVLTHFGKITPPVRSPGLHLKYPRPISKVYLVDRRVRTMTNIPHELITEDQKSVTVDGFVIWRVNDPIKFVEAIRYETSALEKLSELYSSALGIVVSNKSRDAFISLGIEHENFALIALELTERIAPVAQDSYGIEVMQTGIVEYTMPTTNRPSVIQRMIAERGRIAARYRAEGEELAMRIEALAINEHDQIIAEAHAEATQILGEAEAEAMATLGEAYKQDPEFYKFIRALDSYDVIIDKSTTLMLPADSELFKYLNSNQIQELLQKSP